MMRKAMFALCAVFLLSSCVVVTKERTESVEIAKDKKTDYVIVVKDGGATEAEKFAARELKEHLEKVSGAQFQIVDEEKTGAVAA